MHRNQFIFTALVAALVAQPASASASTSRNLCMAAASHCTYTGPDAPVLAAEVCLSAAAGITLKGEGGCGVDARAYWLEHGEVVDPQTGEVAAYIPLDDRCSEAGMCDKAPPGGTQEMPMCCFYNSSGGEVCVNGLDCGGTLWFCYDGVSNDDGTVTCFEAEQHG
ncbi:hypothetical protein ENSA5_22340 [Enhygromyxa salina]|uniref:Uncharacterized protein n=1 Tax=Enhygromyxa salina TaxID=215803 RepID=A0A2S9YBW9_9BACT|nr:hypothetical protein [Enhygromyxa salina]PRQ02589.1 hypothetical protein ENSA5_22340 [Enhygromyxa salina]